MLKFIAATVLALLSFSPALASTTTLSNPWVRLDIVTQTNVQETCSGTYIGNGEIITAAHCTGDNSKYSIVTEDGKTYRGVLNWADKGYDVASIFIGSQPIFTPLVNCQPTPRGQNFFSVGNPLGFSFVQIGGSVASGPVKVDGYWKQAILIDGTVLPGMSGGGMFSDGAFIGVTVGVKPYMYGVTGLGFAVPSTVVCDLLKKHNN